MADDLEAFLRQAAQRRAARKKKPTAPLQPLAEQPATPPPASQRPASQRPASRKPPVVGRANSPGRSQRSQSQRPQSQRPQSQGQRSTEPPIVAESISGGRPTSRRPRLDTSDVEDHADHLGEELGQSDDRLAARLRAKFDHRLGELGNGEMVSDDDMATTNVATEWSLQLARMLRDSQSLKQAVILSELLSPPEHRW